MGAHILGIAQAQVEDSAEDGAEDDDDATPSKLNLISKMDSLQETNLVKNCFQMMSKRF